MMHIRPSPMFIEFMRLYHGGYPYHTRRNLLSAMSYSVAKRSQKTMYESF